MTNVVFQINAPDGTPVPYANVLVAYPNATYLTSKTDVDGKCPFELYRTDQTMKILIAAEGHEPFHNAISLSGSKVVPLEIKPSKDGLKAILFPSSTGYIPGFAGRLSPHKDGYVYGDNIAINGRLANPAVHFTIGEPLHLIDVYGVETTIKFLAVEGQFSLIEYTEPMAYAGT